MEKGVIFVDGVGRVWNGLKSVSIKPSLSDAKQVWVDGELTVVTSTKKAFEATVYAFTYPEEFDRQNQSQRFGFAFQSTNRLYLVSDFRFRFGNMIDASFVGSQNPENFEIHIFVPQTAYVLEVDLTTAPEMAVADIRNLIYGTDGVDSTLPDLDAILSIFETQSTIVITDNGDGTWTASGPDLVIQMLDSTTFVIDSEGVRFLDEDTYTIMSW